MIAIEPDHAHRGRLPEVAIDEGAAVQLDDQRVGRADRAPWVISQIRSKRRNDQIVMNNASNMTDG